MRHARNARPPKLAPEERRHIPRGLYRVGGVAALMAALVFRRNWSAEFSLLRMLGIIHRGPTTPPSTATGWFELLQANPLIGLVLLDLVDVVNYALLGLILLALYAALRRSSEGATAVAAACGLVGTAVYFASNQAFAMLTLSARHAAVTSDTQRAALLAAGEALLAIHNPGTLRQGIGIHGSLLLVTLGSVVIASVMVRSEIFKPRTGYVGLVAELIQLLFFPALAVAPALAALPTSVAALPRLVWYVLIGRRLLQLAQAPPAARCGEADAADAEPPPAPRGNQTGSTPGHAAGSDT